MLVPDNDQALRREVDDPVTPRLLGCVMSLSEDIRIPVSTPSELYGEASRPSRGSRGASVPENDRADEPQLQGELHLQSS